MFSSLVESTKVNKNNLSAETRFKILRNGDKYAEATAKVMSNDGFCPKAKNKIEATKCMCHNFLESDIEGPCKCGRFTKVERTDHEITQYMKMSPWALEEQRKKEAIEKRKKQW